jgi:hypothetical protein
MIKVNNPKTELWIKSLKTNWKSLYVTLVIQPLKYIVGWGSKNWIFSMLMWLMIIMFSFKISMYRSKAFLVLVG